VTAGAVVSFIQAFFKVS